MKPLDLLLLSSEYIEEKEGVVITFSNGKMAKQKHLHYMMLHGLLTDGLREHKLVAKVLNEEIDDVLAFIPVENTEERDFINELTDVVVKHVNHITTYCFDTFKANYTGDRKEFVMKFKGDTYFHYMTALFNENTYEYVEKRIAEDVMFKARRLEMAKKYLRELGFVRELKLIEDDN